MWNEIKWICRLMLLGTHISMLCWKWKDYFYFVSNWTAIATAAAHICLLKNGGNNFYDMYVSVSCFPCGNLKMLWSVCTWLVVVNSFIFIGFSVFLIRFHLSQNKLNPGSDIALNLINVLAANPIPIFMKYSWMAFESDWLSRI